MPSIAFNRPFEEQAEFFRRKLNIPTERWDAIRRGAHDHGFMVAGAMQADLLADLRQAVDKAITEGATLSEFRKDFDAAVEKHGWAHTGTCNWRSKLIYTTNLRTSYAAGRWAQLTDPATLAVRPYWRYVHSDEVLVPRPEHLAWDGLILDATDPWWTTHYPPNGWGCQCTVQAIAPDELSDKYKKDKPDDAPTTTQDIAGIGDGWDYAPGQAGTDTVRLAEAKATDLITRDDAVATAYVKWLMNDEGFPAWYADLETRVETLRPGLSLMPEPKAIKYLRDNIGDRGVWPVAILSAEARGWLGTEAKIVGFSKDTAVKQIYKRGDTLAANEYRLLQEIMDKSQVIIQDDKNDREHLIYFQQGDTIYQAVIKATLDKDALFLVSVHESRQRDIDRAKKKGRVIRDLLK